MAFRGRGRGRGFGARPSYADQKSVPLFLEDVELPDPKYVQGDNALLAWHGRRKSQGQQESEMEANQRIGLSVIYVLVDGGRTLAYSVYISYTLFFFPLRLLFKNNKVGKESDDEDEEKEEEEEGVTLAQPVIIVRMRTLMTMKMISTMMTVVAMREASTDICLAG
ncbi:hypothetical protein AKJ16_DCAP19429 [Drosera capensis]